MPHRSKPSNGSVLIAGNNPPLIKLLENSFLEKEIKNKTLTDNSSVDTDYVIYIFNPTVGPTNIADLVNILNRHHNLRAKFLLLLQVTNLTNSSADQSYIDICTSICQSKNLDYRIVLVADLLAPQTQFQVSHLDNLVKDSFKKGLLDISKAGNTKLYPLYYSDFFDGLARSLFIHGTASMTFYFGGSAINDIDFSLLLKKVHNNLDINLDINQVNNQTSPTIALDDKIDETSAYLNWLPQTELEDSLTKFQLTPSYIATKVIAKEVPKVTNKTIKSVEIHGLFKLTLLFLASSFLLIFIFFSAFSFLLISSLKETSNAYQSLQIGDTKNTDLKLTRSISNLKLSQFFFSPLSPIIHLISPTASSNINTGYLLLFHSGQALTNLNNLYKLASAFYQDSVTNNAVDIKNISTGLSSGLEAFQTELTQLYLLKQNLPSSPKILGLFSLNLPQNLSVENFKHLKSQINSALVLVKALPLAISPGKTSHFLVLIQDNNEYRPTGGYLNSYSLLTFDGNKLIDVKTDSALHLDSKLQGVVKPPDQYEKLTGQANWSFSNSNYFSDFSDSAKQAAWFYEKQTGVTVDAVIGLNLTFYEKLLSLSNPVKLTSGQEVTAQNLRQLLSDPNQDPAADNLTQLSNDIFNQIRSQSYPPALIARSLLDTISSSDLNIYFSNPSLEKQIETTNLAGIIKPVSCPPQFTSHICQADTFYFNESNFSVDKSNHNESRLIQYQTTISAQGDLDYQVIVDFSNPPHKNLIRLYTPPELVVTSVTLDEQVIPKETIIINKKNNLSEIEFPLEFNLSPDHHLVIKLQSSLSLNLADQNFSYVLTTLKQPGIANTDQIVTIDYPNSYKPSLISLPATIGPSIIFKSMPAATSTYAVSFSATR